MLLDGKARVERGLRMHTMLRRDTKCKQRSFERTAYWNIGNVTLASRKTHLTRTTPATGGGENEITYETTTRAYRTLFKMTKVLARSRPLAVVNGSRVPSKSEISLADT